jgi:hypothetical protein
MDITIGMGATIQYHSDREPATIIEVSPSGKRIVIQEDSVKRTDNNGMSECQTYEYSPNPEGTIHVATLRKDGHYRLVGQKTSVYVGARSKYYDFSF